jgi:23S rRNA pseudouridine1911/1915/1917 synthase
MTATTGSRFRPRHIRSSGVRNELELLFEDRDILVVAKPAGLLTIATAKEKRATAYAMLFDYVKSKPTAERLFIVHRLDRDASGLLVFAKNERAKRQLQDQFKNHSAGRTYLAVVEGALASDRVTIESYLAENAAYRCYSTRDRRKGKWAVTHVTVLKRSQARTLVQVRLETGRKHQIRVHLAERGHPVVGDKTYGSARNPVCRLCLHAARLVFKHPQTRRVMEFDAPAPAEFGRLV